VWAIFKSELGKSVKCFGPKLRDNNLNGSASAGINGNGINGSGYRYGRPTNGSDPKSGKNGHSYYQSQALLRKDATPSDENNSQL
jgi:hypothetical protein